MRLGRRKHFRLSDGCCGHGARVIAVRQRAIDRGRGRLSGSAGYAGSFRVERVGRGSSRVECFIDRLFDALVVILEETAIDDLAASSSPGSDLVN